MSVFRNRPSLQFAHLLGLSKKAKPAKIEPRLHPAKPARRVSAEVPDFSHLIPPAPPPPPPSERLEERGAAARAAIAAYDRANGSASRATATTSPARPANLLKPNSPSARAVSLYNHALGRD